MARENPFRDMFDSVRYSMEHLAKQLNPFPVIENKKIVYIAGKITGDTCYYSKFSAASDSLENLGFIVLNPATLPKGMEYEQYLEIGITMLDQADILFLLSDYEDSPGALKELNFAKEKGIKIIGPNYKSKLEKD